jgi:hypothetical protein
MTVYIECNVGGHMLLETDFLLNEIFTDLPYEFVESNRISTYEYKQNGVLIFTSNLHTFEEISDIVNKNKFKVVVHLSDEHGKKNQFNILGSMCELYLRQYNHVDYQYTKNTVHIPLGYTNYGFEQNILGTNNTIIRNLDVLNRNRKYNWSFFGGIKSDRELMISAFKKIRNGTYGTTNTINDTIGYYVNSIFVPCGRGNQSLDCFRMYEASACGAIPVIVGTQEEIQTTFKYENNPPWVFANTWEDAVTKCSLLLTDIEGIKSIQLKLNAWWNTRMSSVKQKVQEIL